MNTVYIYLIITSQPTATIKIYPSIVYFGDNTIRFKYNFFNKDKALCKSIVSDGELRQQFCRLPLGAAL